VADKETHETDVKKKYVSNDDNMHVSLDAHAQSTESTLNSFIFNSLVCTYTLVSYVHWSSVLV